MKKNNYIIEYEKRIAELRKRVIIDSAYIGAGFVIVLHIIGYSEDEISQIMEQVNEVWTKIRESGKNPLIYCKDETGIEMLVSEHEKEIIDEYFKEE